MPVSPQAYRPSRALAEVADFLADSVAPADFPQTVVRFRNDRAAGEIGLETLTDDEWADHLGRFRPLPDTLPGPLALRYHGHQFRQYNSDLGDGRGFTFAQMHGVDGRLLELGTKGSGQTPYSRFGDGRLTLKGGVREILATEMLEALNVPTSRTLSLIETGESLHRGDEPSPTRSAVMVRMSHGHIRIGSFQRLAFERDEENMRRLVAYVLRHFYAETSDDPVRLLTLVAERTATLAARYMAAGFVHGVLNSDNINVTGESFDYGPWRFAPSWDPEFTAAYFDQTGLYALARQPEAIQWDVMQLASSLRLIAESEPLIAALEGFATRYQTEIVTAILWRLGVTPREGTEDRALVQTFERALRASQAPIDRVYFDLFGGQVPDQYDETWNELRDLIEPYAPRRARDHDYWRGEPESMLIDEVEAIWAPIAERDDWSMLYDKVARVRAMGAALAAPDAAA
ncbi:YdiU family protein [Sphingomonas sanguinis]|uniref:protein adenylyltransferase SelO family protein n=1 Tax=Sphingomonas sp. LC-1 TaxID=3110957 RepID=UPI0021BB6553|nr:YdiU family protein [Sphingomonas sp. LC-1]MCT8002436.1 YdiU family protein [Sphingomonas sp. LC-1]